MDSLEGLCEIALAGTGKWLTNYRHTYSWLMFVRCGTKRREPLCTCRNRIGWMEKSRLSGVGFCVPMCISMNNEHGVCKGRVSAFMFVAHHVVEVCARYSKVAIGMLLDARKVAQFSGENWLGNGFSAIEIRNILWDRTVQIAWFYPYSLISAMIYQILSTIWTS